MRSVIGGFAIGSLAALGLMVCVGSSAHAEYLPGEASDRMLTRNPFGKVYLGDMGKTPSRVGRFGHGNHPLSICLVLVFQLPESKDVTFEDAMLTFTLKQIQNRGAEVDYNVALYGLDARSEPDVSRDDFYFDVDTDKANGVTKLQDDILTPASDTAAIRSVDLSGWLNEQYAQGANAGKYVFLRFSPVATPEVASGVINGYMIETAEGVDAPYISY